MLSPSLTHRHTHTHYVSHSVSIMWLARQPFLFSFKSLFLSSPTTAREVLIHASGVSLPSLILTLNIRRPKYTSDHKSTLRTTMFHSFAGTFYPSSVIMTGGSSRSLLFLLSPTLFLQLGTGSVPVRAPHFELFEAFWPWIIWFGTWKVGSQLEPTNSSFSWTWSANCDGISGCGIFYSLE